MDTFEKKLNGLLIDTFRQLTDVEANMARDANSPLSISEIHLLEAVGGSPEGVQSVSGIAAALGITLSSVTIAVGKLVKKGFLYKAKDKKDGRSVRISLTREGKRIYRMHRYFHYKMIRELTEGFNQKEKQVLLAGVEKLDHFFKEKAEKAAK